jgi:hypothetical protein
VKRITLRFELQAWWQAGTGKGDGVVADAVVALDRHGLPYLPGRTVKGLLRAAARTAAEVGRAHWRDGAVERRFGSELPKDASSDRKRQERLDDARFDTKGGTLVFDSATLGDAWAAWADGANNADRQLLRELLASTAINNTTGKDATVTGTDATGTAKDATLRTVEVAAPMTLFADVHGPDNEPWAEAIAEILPLIRGVGTQRNRGFGRVQVEVVQ